jgi:hypothetical protein
VVSVRLLARRGSSRTVSALIAKEMRQDCVLMSDKGSSTTATAKPAPAASASIERE